MTRARTALVFFLAFPAASAPLAAAATPRAAARPALRASDDAAIDALFARFDSTRGPGCAVAVYRGGEVVFARGYGMANLEHGVPITPRTVFRIGSVSKQFTAACIATLALDGTISLDDDVRRWVPELPDLGAVTVRHLVHHTSGIRDYLTLFGVAGYGDQDWYSLDDVLQMLSRQRALDFAPGERHAYSNSGYLLLGEIVHRASGSTIREFAARRIFGPLGMTRTFFNDDTDQVVVDRAAGYVRDGDGYRISMTTLDLVGDGGVFTTVEDLAKWDEAFYPRSAEDGRLRDLMLTRGVLADGTELDYAFGLSHGRHRGLKTIEHGGAFVGFRAQMVRFPDEHTTVVVLANTPGVDPETRCLEVADVVLAGRFSDPPAPEEEARPVHALTDAERARIVGTYASEDVGRAEVATGDGGLVLVLQGARVPLVARSATEFSTVELVKADLTFRLPEDGPAAALDLSIQGRAFTLAREAAVEVEASAADLAAAAGEYRSAELDADATLTATETGLAYRCRHVELGPLAPRGEDVFARGATRITLERDDAGEVTGFRFDLGRAKGIAFTRR